jgi:hypothetical protein
MQVSGQSSPVTKAGDDPYAPMAFELSPAPQKDTPPLTPAHKTPPSHSQQVREPQNPYIQTEGADGDWMPYTPPRLDFSKVVSGESDDYIAWKTFSPQQQSQQSQPIAPNPRSPARVGSRTPAEWRAAAAAAAAAAGAGEEVGVRKISSDQARTGASSRSVVGDGGVGVRGRLQRSWSKFGEAWDRVTQSPPAQKSREGVGKVCLCDAVRDSMHILASCLMDGEVRACACAHACTHMHAHTRHMRGCVHGCVVCVLTCIASPRRGAPRRRCRID